MTRQDDEKAARERGIFEAFLRCDGAPKVLTGSIETRRPPEPDILCVVDGRGPTAFELIEIIENEWAQLVSNQLRLGKALDLSHERLGKPLAEAYGDALIYVRCRPEANIRQRVRTIPTLFDFLKGLAEGFIGESYPNGELGNTVQAINISRGNFGPGPFFQVEAVQAIGDPTAVSIQGKWVKKYETPHRIELLAYYHLHPTIPEAFWTAPVQSFIKTNWKTSPFDRVWICDPGSKRILLSISRDK